MNETSSPDTEYQLREMRAGLERRIEQLEKQRGRGTSRWSPLGALALLVALIAVLQTRGTLHAGTVVPSLEAGSFVLKDAEGAQRAVLGLGEDGGTSLTLSDAGGHQRLRVSVLPDGSPGVSLLDQDGEARAILGLLADGTTTLVFADQGSVARGVFALTPDGSSRMVFSDRDGITRTAVGVDGSGEPEINTMSVSSDADSSGGG
ncbi:MAG: hypothetical protein PVJ02_04525 [Gemmatimonadota bacterium]|jgi:hypothetical protein